MENITQIALASIKANSTARKNLLPGQYEVDELVHVSGTVTVGADYTTTPTVSLPVKEILALFIAQAGLTKGAAIQLLRKSVTDAIKHKGKARGEIAKNVEAVNDTLKEVQQELLSSLPPQARKGKVFSDLAVSAVVDLRVPVAA